MKDNDNEQTTETASVPTYLSLCSGYDGIGIALKRVIPELRTIAHVEIEAFAICNLVTKMEEGQLDQAPVFTDLKRFPFEDLRERQPTILSAGFPCQPFSSAGKRQATDDPRHLWPFIADGITACKPSYCFLENVDGIVSSKTADGESVLLYVLRDLETRGYTCTWGTFSAAEIVGADGRRIPHLRKRVFILAKYVADGVSKGLEGHAGDVDETTGQTGRGTHRPISQSGLSRTVYPSRPGERQCSWEEPRVVEPEVSGTGHESYVADESNERCGGRTDNDGGNERGVPEQAGEERTVFRSEATGCGGDARRELADAECIDGRRERREEQARQPSGEPIKDSDQSDGRSEAQSELGGTTDGTACGVDAIVNRTDRLRLLGNGVVPDCAELAFRTLFNQLHNN